MSASPHPLILGHRGASASAPDNTLRAYGLAVAQDADGIELDVRRTADDHMILHHDAAAGDADPFVKLSFEAVRREFPDVPTLDEMLAVTGDLLLDIEIKNHPTDPDFDPDHRLAASVVAWIQRHQLRGRVIVSSFNWDTVDRVRALDDTIPTGQLLAIGSVADHAANVAERGHQWILPSNAMLGSAPHEPIAHAHEAGLRLMVWTVDDPERITALAQADIDGIITNDPALANEVLAGR